MAKACFLLLFATLILHNLMAFSTAFHSNNITIDRSALLILKSHITNLEHYSILAKNWSATSSVCDWIGITCGSRPQRVTSLDISNMGLTGTIPPQIGNLSFLVYLNMRNNIFRGRLPDEFSSLRRLRVINLDNNKLSGPLPLGLFQCSQLRILSLWQTKFNGTMPREIGNLKMLEILFLRGNHLEGPIPKEIHECSKFEILEMGLNKFDGFIPREIGNLTMLKELYLPSNHLIGTIPEEITKLIKLEELSLRNNSLSGSIPSGIFNLSALQDISVAENNLSGTLPSSMGNRLLNLEHLYIHDNSLSGQLPKSISNASKLSHIIAYNNKFIGPVPNSLGNLSPLVSLALFMNSFTSYSSQELTFITSLTNCRRLGHLDISENPLNGILPISVGNLSTSLSDIVLRNCKIRGNLPNEIGNLSNLLSLDLSDNDLIGFSQETFKGLRNLQKLSLSNNRIKGYFPSSLCDLYQLGYLYLDQNDIAGSILDCIGNLTSLREINISSNRLTSNIPPNLWNLKDLLVLDLSSNSFSGSLPEELENLKVAYFVDLSRNQFIGDIPTTYGSMQNLINFSLASNKLEGSIPQSFGKMLSLESLDLSNNHLSGEIDKSLERLNVLRYFNVSFNKLSGEIPSGGPFKNFTYESFLGNEALCGARRFHVPPCDHNIYSSHDSTRARKLIRAISLITASLVLITMILVILWIMRLKKKEVNVDPLQINRITRRFSYQQIHRATDFFSQENLLGTGSFGSVYRATIENGTVFAVKVFNLQLEVASKSFETECEVLRNLRHKNITKVISACSNLDFKALILEYMENGSLEKWLYSDGHFLDVMQRLDIMIDVASALEYLHHGYHTPVIHCDLKPSNILLDKNMVGHVTDFGIAKFLGEEEINVHTKTLATLGYIAPEYGIEGLVSSASDVYSYGIILMETFTTRRPSDNMFAGDFSLKSWINASLSNRLTQVVDSNLLATETENFTKNLECLSKIMELALNCTAESPRARMNMKDVLTTLKNIKDQYLP